MTEQELIEKAKQLIAIPSTVQNPEARRAAVDFVADFVAQYEGITIERFESNGIPSFIAFAGDRKNLISS
jgi:hypothetical protein